MDELGVVHSADESFVSRDDTDDWNDDDDDVEFVDHGPYRTPERVNGGRRISLSPSKAFGKTLGNTWDLCDKHHKRASNSKRHAKRKQKKKESKLVCMHGFESGLFVFFHFFLKKKNL